MNTAFQKNIDELWWKHGGLVSLQDSWLGDRVVDFHLLKPGEALSEQQRKDFAVWEEKYGTNKLMIRTSHRWDWDWLVDVMPTYKYLTRNTVQYLLETMWDDLWNNELRQYALNEGIEFKVSDCTVGISPDLGNEITHMTEHPNAYEMRHLMMDLYRKALFDV